MEKIIVMEESELSRLIEDVVLRLNEKHYKKVDKQWLTTGEALKTLGIKSRTTLQKLRDNGTIRFSQPTRKIILYDSHSIREYLEKSAKATF